MTRRTGLSKDMDSSGETVGTTAVIEAADRESRSGRAIVAGVLIGGLAVGAFFLSRTKDNQTNNPALESTTTTSVRATTTTAGHEVAGSLDIYEFLNNPTYDCINLLSEINEDSIGEYNGESYIKFKQFALEDGRLYSDAVGPPLVGETAEDKIEDLVVRICQDPNQRAMFFYWMAHGLTIDGKPAGQANDILSRYYVEADKFGGVAVDDVMYFTGLDTDGIDEESLMRRNRQYQYETRLALYVLANMHVIGYENTSAQTYFSTHRTPYVAEDGTLVPFGQVHEQSTGVQSFIRLDFVDKYGIFECPDGADLLVNAASEAGTGDGRLAWREALKCGIAGEGGKDHNEADPRVLVPITEEPKRETTTTTIGEKEGGGDSGEGATETETPPTTYAPSEDVPEEESPDVTVPKP